MYFFLNRIVWLSGLFASVVTIILAWGTWAGRLTQDGRIGLIVISAFAGIFLLGLIWQEVYYRKRARYAEGLGPIRRGVLKISNALCQISNLSAEQILNTCREAVEELAEAFTFVSNRPCAVCIKIIKGNLNVANGEPVLAHAETLCRDRKSAVERSKWKKPSIKHWIKENTDFRELHENEDTPRGEYFVKNFIWMDKGYQNTSFLIYSKPLDVNIPVLGGVLRYLTWKLPYKSTLVVPIHSQSLLVGYLCVDSRGSWIFNNTYDVEIVKSFAECLSTLVSKYLDLTGG